MNELRPQEYYYLYSPWWSDPSEMFKYTVQGLWFEGHISICFRHIYITRSARYTRKRLFIRLGPKYDPAHAYTSSEKFILSHLTNEDTRLYVLRSKVWPKLKGKISMFKSGFVYLDIRQKQLCFSRGILNPRGRRLRKFYENTLGNLDQNIDNLLKKPEELAALVQALGPNVIFLEKNTLRKLKVNLDDLEEVTALFDNRATGASGGIGYSIGSSGGGGGAGGGGWGGFGGGSFGGGGSGGSW